MSISDLLTKDSEDSVEHARVFQKHLLQRVQRLRFFPVLVNLLLQCYRLAHRHPVFRVLSEYQTSASWYRGGGASQARARTTGSSINICLKPTMPPVQLLGLTDNGVVSAVPLPSL